MKAFKKYFIVGTNSNALYDTMNGIVTGELIRCKDCKSWRKSYFESVNEMVCNKTRYIMKPDDYCSMAKRKEE